MPMTVMTMSWKKKPAAKFWVTALPNPKITSMKSANRKPVPTITTNKPVRCSHKTPPEKTGFLRILTAANKY